jgi:hypothetical protein
MNKTKSGKENKAMKKKNEQEPKYMDKSGKEIKYIYVSLYDLVTLYFSQMEQFINTLEMIDTSKIPGIDSEGHQMFLADLGRTLIKDLERKFEAIYEIVEKEVGDIRVDLSNGRTEEDLLLGAYIEKKEIAGQKLNAVAGVKG